MIQHGYFFSGQGDGGCLSGNCSVFTNSMVGQVSPADLTKSYNKRGSRGFFSFFLFKLGVAVGEMIDP
jgi:hypothetical protein